MKQYVFYLILEAIGITLLGLIVLAIPISNLFFLYFFTASIYLTWKYDWRSIFVGLVIFQTLFLLVTLLPSDNTHHKLEMMDDTNQLASIWFVVPILVAPTISIIWILKKVIELMNRGR
jgi:hypothetical protein